MRHSSIARLAPGLALCVGTDLPEQAARLRTHWLDGRQGRPPLFMLALLWGRGRTDMVQTLEALLDGLFADYAGTPEGWSETQAVRQVLASLNMQRFRLARGGQALPELAVGILLIQGEDVHFLRCGNVGLLRVRQGELQSLAGREDGFLGSQAELALTQHNLASRPDEALLLAPQPLLEVMDRRPLQAAGALDADLDPGELLAPLLQAPGAAALLLPARDLGQPGPPQPSAWSAPPALHPGDELEGWRVLERCAYGPEGRLYRVRHGDGREAWLLAAERAADQAYWLREWALRCCKVASLPDVLSPREARRHAFQLLGLPPGSWRSLADWRDARRQPSASEQLGLLRQLVEALRALQRRGVRGLWVSPRQVLVNEKGILVLVPEVAAVVPGVPRQALPGNVLPLAPELRYGGALDSRADQFMVAAYVYWLASGRWPALALPDAEEGARYVPLAERGVRVPAGWDGCLARALAPEPGQRFEAMSEFMQALERPLSLHADPVQGWRRRAIFAALFGATLAGAVLYLFG